MLHKPVQKDPRVQDDELEIFIVVVTYLPDRIKISVIRWKKKIKKKARKKATVSLPIANRREKLGFYVSSKILSDWNEVVNLLHQSLKNDFTWLDEQ